MCFVGLMASTIVMTMTMSMSSFRMTPMATKRKTSARICNSSIFGIVKHENFVASFLYQHLKNINLLFTFFGLMCQKFYIHVYTLGCRQCKLNYSWLTFNQTHKFVPIICINPNLAPSRSLLTAIFELRKMKYICINVKIIRTAGVRAIIKLLHFVCGSSSKYWPNSRPL